MKEATVAAEYLIVGFLCFLNILLFGSAFAWIPNEEIEQLEKFDKDIPLWALIAVFYVLGVLINKLSMINNSTYLPKLIKFFPYFGFLKPWSREDELKKQYVFKNASIYQVQIIENEYKFSILFRCVAILLFPLGFTLPYWLYGELSKMEFSIYIGIVIFLISFLSFKSLKEQYINYWKLIYICYDSLQIKTSTNPDDASMISEGSKK